MADNNIKAVSGGWNRRAESVTGSTEQEHRQMVTK